MNLNIQNCKQFSQNVVPNTFIGGIAKQGGAGVNAPIDTPYKLSQKLDIAVNRITGFKVIGDDVECRIRGSYNLPNILFGSLTSSEANKNIKSFVDSDGLLLNFGRYSFTNTHIEMFYSPTIDFNNNSYYVFRGCVDLIECIIPGSKYLTTNTNGGAFRDCSNPNIVADLSGVIQFTGFQYFQNSGFKEVDLPNLVSSTWSGALSNIFSGMFNCEKISMKKLKVFLPTNVNNGNFNNLKLGCKIEVNEALLTDNSGNPNAQLVWVKNNRGAIVEFYDDNGNYVSTL